MKFELTILGNNSAFPAQGRYPSAQILNHNEELFLIDCGEGTQIRMSALGIKRSRINHILISHLHGDHIFGLPGLINSYQHLTRTAPLHVYGPTGIRQMIETVLRLSRSVISFELVFHELDLTTKQKILDTRSLRIYGFPLTHRVPTFGYHFVEKHLHRNIRRAAIEEFQLTFEEIRALKSGDAIMLSSGRIVEPGEALEPSGPQRSYAYCSDTVYDERIVPWIAQTTLLYHEATFLHALEQKARESMHSTALQAGTMAHRANAGRLLIGHFSSRYDDLTPLREEARSIFDRSEIAEEGQTYPIGDGSPFK